MGTSSNKSTRKYSKRHLGKELTQRKKRRFVNKQKHERETKLQKSVYNYKAKTTEDDAFKEQEAKERKQKENFLLREEQSDQESDLEELEESDLESDWMEDLDLPVVEKPAKESTVLGKEQDLDLEGEDTSDDEVGEEDLTRINQDIAQYKAQLENLKEQDPEFYQYLQQADQQLLHFDEANEDLPVLDTTSEPIKEGVRQLTLEQVKKWCGEVKAGQNLDSLKYLIAAYSVACQYGENPEEQSVFEFSDASVYTHLMTFILKKGEEIFKKYFALHRKKQLRKQDLQEAFDSQKDVAAYLFRFLMSSNRLLAQVLDDRILSFVLRQLRRFICFLEMIPIKIQKQLLNNSLEIFSHGKPASRLQAVLLIRELVIHGTEKLKNLALKGVYKSFTVATSEVSSESVGEVYFMGTCVIEIYTLAPQSAYQNAFKFLKDLAMELREAIIIKEKDSWKGVLTWRFVNSIELWSRLIAPLKDKGDLQELLYPIAQLLSGTVRFLEQSKYLPMRLRLISAINKLSQATGVFIPVASLLLGILSWTELHKKPKININEKCPNLGLILQVDNAVLKSAAFQAEVVEQVLELLVQHLGLFSHSISFPEMSHWIAFQLKKCAKSVQFPSYKNGIMQVVAAIRESADEVLNRRKTVTFSPRDIDKVQQFEKEGKSKGSKSRLEKLVQQFEQQRKQRSSMYSTKEVITLQDPSPAPPKPLLPKKKKADPLNLSDAESLTSDEGSIDVVYQSTKDPSKAVPQMEDILEEYIPSDDEINEVKSPKNKRKRKGKGNKPKRQRQKL